MSRIVPQRDYIDKVGIVTDLMVRAKWAGEHHFCQYCGRSDMLVGLQTHHIIGGVSGGRSDEPCNFLRLCNRDHDRAEGLIVVERGERYQPISLAQQLWLKRESDPHEWNPQRLKELYRRELPELEHIDEVIGG